MSFVVGGRMGGVGKVEMDAQSSFSKDRRVGWLVRPFEECDGLAFVCEWKGE